MAKDIDKTKEYYKKEARNAADAVILDELKKDDGLTLYGAQAINMQLPKYLQKHTEDYDIYADKDPKKEALELEKLLDKRYGDNYFSVKPAKHEGTFKVISNVTFSTIADITLKDSAIPTKKVAGIKVISLDYHVWETKKRIKIEEAKYRREKDKETLQRIEVYEDSQARKSKRRSLPVKRKKTSFAPQRITNPLGYGDRYYLGRKLLNPNLGSIL